MMTQPLISIIVPVYNVAQYLPRCIESILAQTHNNFELILVDDGSADESGTICDEYAAKDSRIITIHQENAGASAARNAGLDAAKGEWIGFVDADDFIEPTMYEKLLAAALEHSVPIAACGHKGCLMDGRIVYVTLPDKPVLMEYETALEYVVLGNAFGQSACNKLFSAANIHDIRFDCGLANYEDALFVTEFIANCKSGAAFVSDEFYNVYVRPNSAARSFYERRLTALSAWEKIAECLAQVSPKLTHMARGQLVMCAVTLILRAVDNNRADLVPQIKKPARPHYGAFLTAKGIGLRSRILGIAVILFPRFGSWVWKRAKKG